MKPFGGVGTAPAFVVAMLLLALSAPATADRFRVDLIVYQDKTGSGPERTLPATPPNLANVLELTDGTQLRAAGIQLLPDDSFGLTRQWQNLANSKRHKPLIRLAWLQKDPPSSKGPGLRLRSGSPMTLNTSLDGATRSEVLYPVDGSVRLLMGRFLHLEADLAYTVTRHDGELGSYRMQTRRRMRRDELHHIDSPRLGILVRILKADVPEKTGN